MSIVDKITNDLTGAMKGGDIESTAVLRLLKSALGNEQIKLGHELNDDEALKVVQREAKQRRDSIDAYLSANRTDLAKDEQDELKIIATYLPEQMGDDELNKIVEQVIAETGATGLAQMGTVIGQVMTLVGGKADGAAVSQVVKDKLGRL